MVGLTRQRDNPDDMFTPQENFARNKQWAKPGPYRTQLDPQEEQAFRQWFTELKKQHGNRMLAQPDDPSYDMRGFYRGMKAGDDVARTSIDKNDGYVHFHDKWKTPYEATFSNESVYARPNAPRWNGDSYTAHNGAVIFDDREGRWFGLPTW